MEDNNEKTLAELIQEKLDMGMSQEEATIEAEKEIEEQQQPAEPAVAEVEEGGLAAQINNRFKPEAEPDLSKTVASAPVKPEPTLTPGTKQSDVKQIVSAGQDIMTPVHKAQKTGDVSVLEKSDPFQKFLTNFAADKKEISNDPKFQELKLNYDTVKQNAIQKKEDAKAKLGWLSLAEKIGNALIMYASGRYGQKHGIDPSGVQYSKTDWDAKMSSQLKEINDEVNDAKEMYGMGLKDQQSQIGDVQKVRELELQSDLLSGREEKRAAEEKSLLAEKQKFDTSEREKERQKDLTIAQINNERAIKVAEDRLAAGKAVAGAKPEKFTHDQALSASYSLRLEEALKEMDDLSAAGYKRSGAKGSIEAMLPNVAQGKLTQQQAQAERNFLTGTLRRESGATISDQEFASGEKMYFPRAGDTPEVLEQKRKNRLQTLAGMKATAGNAYTRAKEEYAKALGETEAPAAQVGGSDKKVQDYADQYFGGDYQKALDLLKKRGYKGE